MSLLISLSTSSFFLSHYLTERIHAKQYSPNQLQFALKKHNITALKVAIAKTESDSLTWKKMAKILAKTESLYAFKLGQYYQQQQGNIQGSEHAEQKNAYLKSRAIFWFKQAIKLNSLPAQISLAKIYFQNNQIDLAQQMLLTLSLSNAVVMQLKMQLAIVQGDSRFVAKYWQKLRLQSKNNIESQQLVQDILTFNVLNTPLLSIVEQNSCSTSIQLFATNLPNLKRMQQLLTDFKQYDLNQYFCFNPIRYIPLSILNCRHQKDQAIVCDESQWLAYANEIDSRFVGVMLPYGGANVHLGILYIDAKDDIDVFSHELTHLLGFVDEYPLPKNHQKCAQKQTAMFSHNVAVLASVYQGKQKVIRSQILDQLAWREQIKATTPILQKTSQGWLLGTPKKYQKLVGLYPAKSCQQQGALLAKGVQAYKASSSRSHLEYFEQPLPSSYLRLLATEGNNFLMPSFHYNIAIALRENGRYSQAKVWFTKASTWEVDGNRKQKINVGDF